MADHGIAYEHDGFFQQLFGTSYQSAFWQLQNKGYKIRFALNYQIEAEWDEGFGLVIDFDGLGLVSKIHTVEYYHNFFLNDGEKPSNTTPKEVKRRPHKIRRI